VQKQGSLTKEQLVAELNRSKGERTSEATNAIYTSLAWMPGNLFQGPDRNLRTEDPDEGFESSASNAVGKEDFERHAKVNTMITDYASKPTPEKAQAISNALLPSAKQRNPFPYKPEVWEEGQKPEGLDEDPGSLYRLKGTQKTDSEDKAFRDRVETIKKEKAKALAEEENKRKALEEYKNRKKDDDDEEDMGTGGLFS
jgi:hypothetical protein